MRSSLLLFLFLVGCGGVLTNAGKDTTNGVVSVLSDEATKKAVEALVSDATTTARNDLLNDATKEQLRALVRDAVNEALSKQTMKQAAELRETLIGAPLLADGDALRERLFGAPLQGDLNALMDDLTPRLTKAVQSAMQASVKSIKVDASGLRVEADAEAAKWKPIAIGFAVGSGMLLVAAVVGLIAVLQWHKATTRRAA